MILIDKSTTPARAIFTDGTSLKTLNRLFDDAGLQARWPAKQPADIEVVASQRAAVDDRLAEVWVVTLVPKGGA